MSELRYCKKCMQMTNHLITKLSLLELCDCIKCIKELKKMITCKNCGYELERCKNRWLHKISKDKLHFCGNPQSSMRYNKKFVKSGELDDK